MVSLLFSFMVIWDLPNLSRGMKALKTSRLGFAYNTISPQVPCSSCQWLVFLYYSLVFLAEPVLPPVPMRMIVTPFPAPSAPKQRVHDVRGTICSCNAHLIVT